ADAVFGAVDICDPAVVHPEIGDLGVGLDTHGLSEVGGYLVGPLQAVDGDDVVHGPEEHEREDTVEEDEVDEGAPAHWASSSGASWNQPYTWAKSPGTPWGIFVVN